jgi:peptide/nickel transport system ATP-binding protein
MSTPLIEVRSLKKFFATPHGMLHAVDGVNLSIEKGTTLGIVGESGCGKSTLGRVILRLIEATGGEVLYNGENILDYSEDKMLEMRKHLQIIFQDPYASLNPRMTVSEIIAEPIRVCRTITNSYDIMVKVYELMETVGLAQRFVNTYPHELDGGRRQRIGIARALALDPEFIVCDEPVSALDVSIQAQVLNLLMDLQEERGLTYMFVTHNLSVVKHISNEIAVMYLGQCVERTSSDTLFEKPLHPYTQALLAAIPTPNLSRRGKPRNIIRGELTSPINPKPGCRFATRCPFAQAQCTQKDIPLREIAPGHFVACTRY